MIYLAENFMNYVMIIKAAPIAVVSVVIATVIVVDILKPL